MNQKKGRRLGPLTKAHHDAPGLTLFWAVVRGMPQTGCFITADKAVMQRLIGWSIFESQ
jgi:hypothetical protein